MKKHTSFTPLNNRDVDKIGRNKVIEIKGSKPRLNKVNLTGFTLIELLVVIAIIGLLSTIAIISLNNSRLKARDAKRISDLNQVRNALELYFNDCYSYPAALTVGGDIVGTDGNCNPANDTTYMKAIPSNPTPWEDGGCPTSDYIYTRDSQSSYHISYCLGGGNSGIPAGSHNATPASVTNP